MHAPFVLPQRRRGALLFAHAGHDGRSTGGRSAAGAPVCASTKHCHLLQRSLFAQNSADCSNASPSKHPSIGACVGAAVSCPATALRRCPAEAAPTCTRGSSSSSGLAPRRDDGPTPLTAHSWQLCAHCARMNAASVVHFPSRRHALHLASWSVHSRPAAAASSTRAQVEPATRHGGTEHPARAFMTAQHALGYGVATPQRSPTTSHTASVSTVAAQTASVVGARRG